jgi:hypothetical protein
MLSLQCKTCRASSHTIGDLEKFSTFLDLENFFDSGYRAPL